MKKITGLFILAIGIIYISAFTTKTSKDEWVSLFDGKTMNNWKVGDHASSFSIQDGAIVANGDVGHLFYEGPVNDHVFKNFEFKTKVMTTPGSNSGIFFHTMYQEAGWPARGYEVQVNNSQQDWRRTGSLYSFSDVKEVYVKDNEWFTEHIIVTGKHVVIKINDKTVTDYMEQQNLQRNGGDSLRRISTGTFALQAHDPKSKVFFKDIQVKILPD